MEHKLRRISTTLTKLLVPLVLYGCSSSEPLSESFENCDELVASISYYSSYEQYDFVMDKTAQLSHTCPEDNDRYASQYQQGSLFKGQALFASKQYQQTADITSMILASNYTPPAVRSDADFFYNLSMAYLHPEKANDYLMAARKHPEATRSLFFLDASYDLGQHDMALMHNYMAIIHNSNKPLDKYLSFSRPISLAKELGDSELSKKLTYRRDVVQVVNLKYPPENEFHGPSSQYQVDKSKYKFEVYEAAGLQDLAAYYKLELQTKQEEFEVKEEENRRLDARLEAQQNAPQPDVTKEMLGALGNIATNAAMASAAGVSVEDSVKRSLADVAVNMSDDPVAAAQMKNSIESIAAAQMNTSIESAASTNRECNRETPAGFEDCCRSYHGQLSVIEKSDGIMDYGCIIDEKRSWGCNYQGNVMVGSCATK